MRFKLLLVITITAIGQISEITPATAESTQLDKLVSHSSLAKSIAMPQSASEIDGKLNANTNSIPTAKEIVALA